MQGDRLAAINRRGLKFLSVGAEAAGVTVRLGDQAVSATNCVDGRQVVIALEKPLKLKAGQTLRVEIALR